jgi:hypothetical protein
MFRNPNKNPGADHLDHVMRWSGDKLGCIVPYRHGDRNRHLEAAMPGAPYQISAVPKTAASTKVVVVIDSL